MIRVLLWKEYREHRSIWLSLAVVGGVGLYALSYLIPNLWGLGSAATRDSLQSVAVMLAWTYGLVCGSMLFANEAETGAIAFLEQLPLRRARLWWVKTLFGFLLFVLQLALLSVFVVALGVVETPRQFALTFLAMTALGTFSLAWGLLFSARGDNVLNVIGLSILGQLFGAAAVWLLFVVLAVLASLLEGRESGIFRGIFLCLAALAAVAFPTIGSFRWYTRLDRQRFGSAEVYKGASARPSFWASWKRLLWMNYIRMRRMLVGLSLVGLIFGLALPLLGPLAWPALTLLLGVLCGITVWSDEQFSASFRFLGDQRFPLGRVWLVKIGVRLVLTAFVSFVLLLPSLILALTHRFTESSTLPHKPFWIDLFHCDFVGTIVPIWAYATLWPLYGFSVGQLAGLLFRKSLVAGFVALGMAGLLVSLWTPSLLGMGLHLWQVAGVPVLLLAASRMLVSAWTADRLLARGSFVRLGAALILAGMWTAGAIAYRVVEIPYLPEPFDVAAFNASIPSLAQETNPAGMEIRGVWKQVELMTDELRTKRRGEPLFADLRDNGERDTFFRQIETACARGWPNRPSELGAWLDKRFQEEWYRQLASTARLPVGAVEDTKILTINTRLSHLWNAIDDLNRILSARGLQRQAEGDPLVFVENVRIGLALSRNLRNRTPPLLAQIGLRAELGIVQSALDPWLEKLPHDVRALEQLRDVLLEHERLRPGEGEALKAQYLIAQNSLDFEPARLIASELPIDFQESRERKELVEAECEAAALCWRIPWERERHERILRIAYRDDPREHRKIVQWGGTTLGNLIWLTRQKMVESDSLVVLRAALLKTAIRLYQANNRERAPEKLTDLTPTYLPAVPNDPYDGQPFRYRVSKGEKLICFEDTIHNWARFKPVPMGPGGPRAQNIEEETHFVAAGRAILWSVGDDGHDDGGTRQGAWPLNARRQSDLIYLVPPAAK